MKTIICDIDHTLADAAWRDHLRGHWEAYHEASKNDKPNVAIAQMVRSLGNRYSILALTGRTENYRRLTFDWLVKHSIPVDELIMRPEKDYRPSPIVKVEQIRVRFPDLSQIAFCLEDRDDVCEALQQWGLCVLQVKPGYIK